MITNVQKQQPAFLYKIMSEEDWETSQRQHKLKLGQADDQFIHLSTEEQIDKIYEKFFRGMPVVILKIKTDKLHGKLVKERNPGGMTEYYHLYDGSIPMDAVVSSQAKPGKG